MDSSIEITQIYHGTLIHSITLDKLEIIKDGLVGVDELGKIVFVEREVSSEMLKGFLVKWGLDTGFGEKKIRRLNKRQFLMPGFVDTHTHAPQYPNAGTGMDLPLLDWLNKYTFPLETSFSSLQFAQKVYPTVVNRLLRSGTTTAVYFATMHLETSKYLAKLVYDKGQRAFVGKVNMDRNVPDTYIETKDTSINDTRSFIEHTLEMGKKQQENGQSPLVMPIITPRFAIACSAELLSSLGELARNYDIPIQSHLSENREEVQFVQELFSDIESYAEVYDKFGLLGHKTIMAHAVHLLPTERILLKKRNVGISHCPNANFTILSGVCHVRELLNDGIKVGLGTDISAGSAKCILDAVRNASIASRVISMSSHDKESDSVQVKPLTLVELTYLATMGGAELCNLENVIGNFRVGKEFDALLVDTGSPDSPFDVFDGIDDEVERIFEKFMFLGDERNLRAVFVQGRKVSGWEVSSYENFEAVKEHDAILPKNGSE
ncbi:hypothetical protein G9A89_006330 [Geosiphon pyriformis]|nr:hypothetical protein G9A89_006330 [Geosiphon pyriformis]